MRRMMIALLNVGLAMAGSAHAQGTFGGSHEASDTGTFGGPDGSAPATRRTPSYGVATPEPYKPHAARSAPKPPGTTDGGEAFKPYEPYKPFKAGSVYSPPGSSKTKPKSMYDR